MLKLKTSQTKCGVHSLRNNPTKKNDLDCFSFFLTVSQAYRPGRRHRPVGLGDGPVFWWFLVSSFGVGLFVITWKIDYKTKKMSSPPPEQIDLTRIFCVYQTMSSSPGDGRVVYRVWNPGPVDNIYSHTLSDSRHTLQVHVTLSSLTIGTVWKPHVDP